MTIQNIWDAAKAGKLTAIQCYLREQEKHSNNLTLHLQQLEREQTTPKLVEGKKS